MFGQQLNMAHSRLANQRAAFGYSANAVNLSDINHVFVSEGEDRNPEDNHSHIFLPLKFQVDLLFTR